ncbi:hypothetical protein P7C70_g7123, partial [Phenoliferia sp. Uapishka_3]
MDLIADTSFPLPLLVPQTVLDEVRHRSLPLYNRLKTLIEEDFVGDRAALGKRGWIVWNEACEETFLDRIKGESPNDRNDRAIRHLASYYSAILTEPTPKRQKTSSSTTPTRTPVSVLLLTDDADNKRKALSEGIDAKTVREYVESLPNELSIVLLDLLAASGSSNFDKKKNGAALYAEYLPPSVFQAGIKSGQLFQGHFNPSLFNYKEATVSCHGRDKPILIVGLESMNRSIAGDVVVVELLPESDWKGASTDVVDEDVGAKNDDADSTDVPVPSTSPISSSTAPKVAPQPTGKIVGIIKRNWRTYVCHLDRSSLPPSALTSTTSTSIFASPVSRSIPRIKILTRQALHLSSQKFLVSIDRWGVNSRYPEGHFVRTLGEVGSKEGELESLLEEWEVPYRAFSAGILECLPKEGE